MQLRNAGLLDPDDRLDVQLAELPSRSPTIRRALAHLSVFRREVDEMWLTGEAPTAEELIAAVASFTSACCRRPGRIATRTSRTRSSVSSSRAAARVHAHSATVRLAITRAASGTLERLGSLARPEV